MQVLVRENNVEQALRALKLIRKKMQREGLLPSRPKPAARGGGPGATPR